MGCVVVLCDRYHLLGGVIFIVRVIALMLATDEAGGETRRDDTR